MEAEKNKQGNEEALKILISAEGADLKADVGNKFGVSRYLLVIDLETMAVEALPNPGASGQKSGGMQAVALAISKKVDTVLAGYCSPSAEKYFLANGIEVLTGLRGTVAEVVERYRKGNLVEYSKTSQQSESGKEISDRLSLLQALGNSSKQFVTFLPVLTGVVLSIGLLNAFVSQEILSSLFSGSEALDTLLGACFGSILAGNPINSYIIGGELLDYGLSLFGVTAFIVAWVSVGLVQLPAEISFLGCKFALVRNALSFIMAMIVAFVTVIILSSIAGGFY